MDRHLTDTELDALLARATQPALPDDFEAALLRRLGAAPAPAQAGESNVIAFPQRRTAQPSRAWLAGLPLAASLVLGVWLGVVGDAPSFVGSTSTTEVSALDDGATSGVEDFEYYAEEGRT